MTGISAIQRQISHLDDFKFFCATGGNDGNLIPSPNVEQRRRIKTVMQALVYFTGRYIRHARGLTLRFSCQAQDQADEAFARIYNRFADA